MSRFGNLEFGDESRDARASNFEVKDESYYLAEAREAYQKGDFENGLRAFAKVLEYNPKNPEAWTGQVRMLIELEEYQEAKLWADKALETLPREPELLAAKGVALARLGDLKGALAFSDAAMEERGEGPYIWLARGDVFCARKEKRADYCFSKAVMLAPGDWFMHWLVSRVHRFYKQFSMALKYAQQALAINSSAAVVWLEVGDCQRALGLLGLAQHSFEQALQLDRENAGAGAALNELSSLGLWARISSRFRQLFHS